MSEGGKQFRTWEEEYRASHEKEEELAFGHVESLQTKIASLERDLRRQHRKTVFARVVIVVIVAFEIWYYSTH